ncbi:MAG: hypothetical protein K6E40_08295 [Desulfovibrio sp.]|nr:hypothetical protein [Desulfovibrio sp.]
MFRRDRKRIPERRAHRRRPAVPAAPDDGAEESPISLFSFFRKKARPAKKDFDWFLARLLSQAEEDGWNDGHPLPDVDLVLIAEETSRQIEKGVCEACRKEGMSDSDADAVLFRIMRTCFFAGIAAWRHWNRKDARATGMYRTITHEAGVGRMDRHELFLMGLADRRGAPTPRGRALAAFAGKAAEDAANELAGVLEQHGKGAFATAKAEAREAMFVGGTIVGAGLMPKVKP